MNAMTSADHEHFVIGAIHEVTPRRTAAVMDVVRREIETCGVHGLVVDLSRVNLGPGEMRALIELLEAAPLEGHWRIRVDEEEIVGAIAHHGPTRRPA